MSALLDVQGLNVWIDQPDADPLHIVRDVSFSVAPGERLAIVGESGCGKSTALLALLGLLPGSASVNGSARFRSTELLTERVPIAQHRWRDIAAVFQGSMNAFSPVVAVGPQIAEPMILHECVPKRVARKRAEDLLCQVGLRREHYDRFPHELSGGMRQRAVLAMALACEPQLLVADEPTTALDLMVQAQILELLHELARAHELALIMVTHDLAAVGQVCGRAIVMYAGEVIEEASVEELAQSPRHPYTRLLFEAMPSLDVSRPLRSIPGAPPGPDVHLPGCPFAPRCDRAFAPCPTVAPPRFEIGPGHSAACLLNAPKEVRA
ncbi:MAG: ABC transporter ATP-binding protein [Conexibacter sp.]